eukprot:TRINITY_DN5655_c0_g1_i1.p1 TRINITY_DN5655_c0_g1~~TRINITY_DN5655_c0_g1_i1.p1  ORF type:complete len:66 (-),score=4.69 TRINITY_DN5655_c0_g1_i1:57-254(-)
MNIYNNHKHFIPKLEKLINLNSKLINENFNTMWQLVEILVIDTIKNSDNSIIDTISEISTNLNDI